MATNEDRVKLRLTAQQAVDNTTLPQEKLEGIKAIALLDIAEALEQANSLSYWTDERLAAEGSKEEDTALTPEQVRAQMEADPNYIPLVSTTKKKTTRTKKTKVEQAPEADKPKYAGTNEAQL